MSNSVKSSIIKGSAWSLIGQILIMSITLLANVMLARMLTPKDFGKIGIIMVFINIAYVLTEGGLSAALIRKTNASYRDYSTVFVFNFIIGIAGFLLIAGFSGIISNVYGDQSLKYPLIASAAILIINSFQFIQNTKLIAEMRYKEKSMYEFTSVILSSVAGVLAAYNGLHVWSIVVMQLSRAIFLNILYFIFEKYKYSLVFSKASFKELYGFGVNTSLSSLINITFDNIYQLILGAFFSINQVGFYYQAKKIQDVPAGLFSILSQGPVYAGLAKIQHEKEKFINAYNKVSAMLMFLTGIITVCFFIFSDDIIVGLFGKEWLQAGFYLKFLCVSSFFFTQENLNRVIFKIFNKTRSLLFLEMLKKVVQIFSIFVGIYYKDIQILLIGIIVSNAFGYFINYFIASKILNHSEYKELNYILTVSAVILGTVFIAELAKEYFVLEGLNLLFLLFAVVIVYATALKLFGIIDTKKQIKELLTMLK
ncbi:MAG: lipopolysaccharide biosynthesis protein [Flavobacteriales bacterium]|nr:lipopolysaccharide biosynthesis protein [Flavobacteriales bacterium]